MPAIIVEKNENTACLVVTRLIGQQEIVVKNLGKDMRSAGFFLRSDDIGRRQSGHDTRRGGIRMSLASETRTELDDLQMDSLKEVGIVGAEHATGALSKLIKNNIANDVTECHVEPLGTLPSSFGRPGDKIAVISIDVVSEKASRILMILPRDVAINYSDKLFGAESQPGRELNDNDKEALIEMGDMCIR